MSCGLGAVILVFMLVKHNVEVANPLDHNLEAELETLNKKEANLDAKLSTILKLSSLTDSKILEISKNLNSTQKELLKRKQEAKNQSLDLEALKRKIEKTEVSKTADVINDPIFGEENYLIGLKVEGSKIVILVDASSSMTDEKLINIIRRKNQSDQIKRSGPKWVRVLKIVRWLLARIPQKSKVQVVSFNDKASKVGPNSWTSSNDASALGNIISDLDKLIPFGPTNLEAGLDKITNLNPSSIYLITDGLPTKGSSAYKSLNPFAACSALWGKSSTISGECREKLFVHTVGKSSAVLRSKINVIMLPIEGDPTAASAYWSWASPTGGLVISPAQSWP